MRTAFANWLGGFLVSCLFCLTLFAGCPKPTPPPVTPPDASDAAPPPACATSCNTACRHLLEVAPQASTTACLAICGSIAPKDPDYPCCVAIAANARAADDCDRGAAPATGKKPVNGR